MTLSITRKDENIRKLWLYFTLGYFLVCPFILYGLITNIIPLSSEIYSPFISDFFIDDRSIIPLPSFVGRMIVEFLYVFFLIHCAYKKPGTALLAYCTFTGLLLVPVFWARWWLILNFGYVGRPLNQWTVAILLFESITVISWAYVSLKLRRVNKKIQAQKFPAYLQRLEELGTAASLENLDDQYSALVLDWPQYEPFTSSEYRAKKALLT